MTNGHQTAAADPAATQVALSQTGAMRIVQVSSLWKVVGALSAVIAIAFSAHAMFVVPSILNAAHDQTHKQIVDHAQHPHTGSATAQEVANLRAQMGEIQASVQTLLVEQGKSSAQLDALRDDVRELKNR